jgi:branched-subunit amino acid ABC-type transport system permease component
VSPILAQLERFRLALFILVPIGLMVAGAAGWLLAKKSLRPLHELTKIIDEVSRDFSQPD